MIESAENLRYKVVVNHEEQYALWLHGRENAAGWKDTGVAGMKSECLDYIRQIWTDLRPLSLRKAMSRPMPGQGARAGFASDALCMSA